MNTTQDALSGTGYNVYSFAVMLRPPGLQIILYYYIWVKSFQIIIMLDLSVLCNVRNLHIQICCAFSLISFVTGNECLIDGVRYTSGQVIPDNDPCVSW